MNRVISLVIRTIAGVDWIGAQSVDRIVGYRSFACWPWHRAVAAALGALCMVASLYFDLADLANSAGAGMHTTAFVTGKSRETGAHITA